MREVKSGGSGMWSVPTMPRIVVVAEPRPVALLERRELRHARLLEEVRRVAVTVREVLGEHG